MLDDIARRVRAGRPYEGPWAAFRHAHFPGRGDEDAAREMAEWAAGEQLKPNFVFRKVSAGTKLRQVIYLELTALEAKP